MAFGLMEYALRNLSVSQYRTEVTVQKFRTAEDGGAFERHDDLAPRRSAPELRQHRDAEQVIER
jgi:hypothetical protein